jgi:hypothetical protein
VTIVAASIPVLRKFLGDKVSSPRSHAPTAFGSSGRSRHTGKFHLAGLAGDRKRRISGNIQMLTTNHESLKQSLHLKGKFFTSQGTKDDESEKGILGPSQTRCPESNT